MYYRSKQTGRIVLDNAVQTLKEIFDPNYVDLNIIGDVLEPIPEPHIIDCIKYGGIVVGGLRYRDLHPGVTPKEAIKAVKQIKTTMYRINHPVYKSEDKES